MTDIWETLEERTRGWGALARQQLADEICADYVSFRFGRTGDPRALEYLYPYLKHAGRETRLRAIDVAARVFEGRGAKVVDQLDYFTKNPNHSIRERSVVVVGAAVTGSPDSTILDVLRPYLDHRAQFIRKLALVALGKAAAGQASQHVLSEIQRVGAQPGPRSDEVDLAIARDFSGRPTEEAYRLVAKPELADRIDTGNERAVSVLVRGATDDWYLRACEEAFEPRLHVDESVGWRRNFIRRDGIHALGRAGAGRGMDPLNRMLHLRGDRCTGHAMMYAAQKCFVGADVQANRGELIGLATKGDVPAQRIAAVCLGRLTMGLGDQESIKILREMCSARNKAVQSAALRGIGMAGRSTCDEQLRKLCLERSDDPETARAAIHSLGLIYLGSGRSDVFDDLHVMIERLRSRPVTGKKHFKPLATCYLAVGLVYLGTGSDRPLSCLLDVIAAPRAASRYDEYKSCAARALIMTEFSHSALGWEYLSLLV